MAKTKGKKNKRVSVPKKKGRKPSSYMMPDWMHWLITIALIAVFSVGSYYLYLRPYLYRLRPCRGTKEYGVCLPTGFLCYGIDISHHQGSIDWNKVAQTSAENGIPIRFVMMKATEGSSFTDSNYADNIVRARNAGFVCGSYHFYDPWTSPERQAEHFIRTANIKEGDMAPIVDVERAGRSSGDLQRELLVFIKALEDHYGVKPIIYASAKFRRRHLSNAAFDAYPFWVAHYYVVRPETPKPWVMWQFTDHASVEGISGHTDFNVFKGTESDFNKLRIH